MDLYNKPFYFLLPSGDPKHRTVCGAFVSILIIIVILSYASYKFLDMYNYGDYKLYTSLEENYFTELDALKSSDGFSLAAGVVDLNTLANEPSIEDPEIGTIKIYRKFWDAKADNGLGKLWFVELQTRFCNSNDMNNVDGDNTNSKFYSSTLIQSPMIKKYANKLKCI